MSVINKKNSRTISKHDRSITVDIALLSEAVHEAWRQERKKQGWDYGPKRNDTRKEHPCMVDYEELPEQEQLIDENSVISVIEALLENEYAIFPPHHVEPSDSEYERMLKWIAADPHLIFLNGPPGVGKTFCAKGIWENYCKEIGCSVKDIPFVTVDCASLHDETAYSTLFGHKKGAFTGATEDKKGLLREANDGILFLDEICELSQKGQKLLLQFLEHPTVTPLGGKADDNPLKVIIISASNVDVDKALSDGRLREDFVQRFRSATVNIPPLRERKNEVKDIAEKLIEKIRPTSTIRFSDELMQALVAFDHPDNVRGLKNIIHNICRNYPHKTENVVIELDHIPSFVRDQFIKVKKVNFSPVSFGEAKDYQALLINKLAENIHNMWGDRRQKEGVTRQENPYFVEWEDLSPSEQSFNKQIVKQVMNALEVVKREGVWRLDEIFTSQDPSSSELSEEAQLKAALTRAKGKRKEAAKLLDLNEETMKKRMQKYKLRCKDFKSI